MNDLQKDLIPLSTGEQLRQGRLSRNLSLEQVAGAICHDVEILAAIENDRAEHIASIYKKGYIRAYAHYLGFPVDKIQALVQAAIDNSKPQETAVRTVFTMPVRRKPADRWLRVASYMLASLLVGTLAWQFSREAVRLSQAGLPSQIKTQGALDPVATSSTQSVANATVNASIAPLGVLHAGQVKTLDPAVQAWASLSQPALPAGISRLRVSVSADSWVEITDADGRELEMDLLRGGREKTYQGRRPYQILLGHASATLLFMDGEPVDFTPFTNDDVARLSWPPEEKVGGHRDDRD